MVTARIFWVPCVLGGSRQQEEKTPFGKGQSVGESRAAHSQQEQRGTHTEPGESLSNPLFNRNRMDS